MKDYLKAVDICKRAHEGQFRKETDVPYWTHPYAVSKILDKCFLSQDEVIAGLLHDVLEDCDPKWHVIVKNNFSNTVWRIVNDCSDTIKTLDAVEKPPWLDRKTRFIEKLTSMPVKSLNVCCADKIHNLQCIFHESKEVGPKVFDKFNAGRDAQFWYYGEVLKVFESSEINKKLLSQYKSIFNTVAQI